MSVIRHQSVVTFAILAALLTIAKASMAQPPSGANTMPSGPPPFSYFDKDGDGVVTLEEFRRTTIPEGEHDAVFASIDANSDGVIKELELISHVPPEKSRRRGPPSFDYLDIDGDGILKLVEFSSLPIPEGRHDEIFAAIDANGDDVITKDEFSNHKRPIHDKRPLPPQNLDDQLDPIRVSLLEPERIIRLLDIKPGAKILDLGAGFGLFTFPLAEAAGERGRVLATDVDETVIKYLSEQIKQRGARNVDAVRVSTEATDPVYSRFVYDVIFASDVWVDIKQASAFLSGSRISLQPETGRLWIVSWRLDPDFTAVEFSDINTTAKLLQSSERASLMLNRLSEDSRIALTSSGDGAKPAINEHLISDLNRILEDTTLWPAIQGQARAAGQEPLSNPDLAQVALNLSSRLDGKGVFGSAALPKDRHTLKQLRGLNRLVIQDFFGTEVWVKAFGPSDNTLRFLLDWVELLTFAVVEPIILEEAGFEFVQEHKFLPYHRIFEFKRRL